ncbi:unnamed protein product [Caenorhabditis bovis]|uniref:phospholipase A2 n=1 Tax=Caenorhabditis bovis TaxID=2654633 RepID=A0A8S1EMI7_9PELO|nr:unnamed protein product [Caenorhabditis bovis]
MKATINREHVHNGEKHVDHQILQLTGATTCFYQPTTSRFGEIAPSKSPMGQLMHPYYNAEHRSVLNRSFSNPEIPTSSFSNYVLGTAEVEADLKQEDICEMSSSENNKSMESFTDSVDVGIDVANAPEDFIFVDKGSIAMGSFKQKDQSGNSSPLPGETDKLINRTSKNTPTSEKNDTSYTLDTVVSLVRNVPAILNKWLKKPWYASRSDEVCTFPYMVLSQYKIIPTDIDNDKFLIAIWDGEDNRVDEFFHLTYAPFGFYETNEKNDYNDSTKKPVCFSLYRATDKKEIMDLLHLCDKKTYLFETTDPHQVGAKTKFEELLSQIRSKPHYQLIHLAIASDRLDFFSDESIVRLNATNEPFKNQLRSLCNTENCYPVHLAVAMNRIKIVERLLELEPQLFTETDTLGNNVWHHVSSATCAVAIWDKCADTHRFIDERNNEGQTPLTEAVSNAKPLVTTFLIRKGAKFGRGERNELFLAMLSKNAQSVVEVVLATKPEIVHERDSLGNSAIHVACYKESLNALLHKKNELGLNIDLKNNVGETALLVYMSSKKPDLLPLLVTLYAHGADLNATDPHGNTALHKAAALVEAKKINMDCVKFLISAGADPNKVNERGESPRHLAAGLQNHDMLKILKVAGAKRCPRGYRGCRSECRSRAVDQPTSDEENDEFLKTVVIGTAEDYEKTELTDAENLNNKKVLSSPRKGKRSRINLISFDGGGIRGLVIIQTLIAIEEALGEPIFKYFDWAAGTSTGSLIMAGLACGKSLRQMQQTYLLLKDRVFDGYIPPFDTLQLEKFIQDEFGMAAVSAIKYPRLMISAVNSEKLPVRLEMARNYKSPDPKDKETPKDLPLWMALRRSTAAPVLFKPSEDRYIDGGIISNNPALDLMSEVHEYNRRLQMSQRESHMVQLNCIVSFGTGQIPCTTIDTLSIDTNSPLQTIKTIKNLAAMFIDQATASEGAPVVRSRQWADSLETPFFRFSAPLSKNIFLSSTSDQDVCTMMWDSYIYCRKHRDYIKSLISILRHDASHPLQSSPFIDL